MNTRIEDPPTPGQPHAAEPDVLGIGLLGCGVVGSAVARLLAANRDDLTRRWGRTPVIRAVAVRDLEKPRDVPLPRSLFTAEPLEIVDRDDVDVVIEVMGGLDPSGALIEVALLHGKDVVTANKELLARRRHCLQAVADSNGRRLLYEASVMSGVPVVDTLSRLAAGDRITRVEGVLNGTTNFCLHRMETEGLTLEQALEEAEALGYAEADPTADIDGADAAAKLAILSSLAFGRVVGLADVDVAGIRGVERRDMDEVRRNGESIRLVAEAWVVGPEVIAQVAPKRLPRAHPLAGVEGHHNALAVETEAAGRLFFHGAGAGGDPTASAVIRDLAALTTEVIR